MKLQAAARLLATTQVTADTQEEAERLLDALIPIFGKTRFQKMPKGVQKAVWTITDTEDVKDEGALEDEKEFITRAELQFKDNNIFFHLQNTWMVSLGKKGDVTGLGSTADEVAEEIRNEAKQVLGKIGKGTPVVKQALMKLTKLRV